MRLRLEALDVLRREPGFLTLALAHKRIKNILKDRKVGPPDGALLHDDAERALEGALRQAMPLIETAQARADHLAALRAIERLGPHLDRFFAEVLVMAEDPRLRDNRLGLLREIGGLLLRVADFSEMAVDTEPAPRGTAPGSDAARGKEAEA